MHIEIVPIDKYTFNDSVKLLQLFFKEHRNLLMNRKEAEEILKDKNNVIYVLLVEGEVRGLYVYQPLEEVYVIKAFILHPLVRRTKRGYMLWKHMKNNLKNKPAIIGIIRDNKAIKSIIEKRGHYIGSGLDYDKNTIDFYNLSFKEMKG